MYKKISVFCLVLVLIVSSLSALASQQENLRPSTGRNDILYVGGHGPGNYSTIQSAVDAAVDGDTVFVFDDSSPYTEEIDIGKSINLVGENKLTTVIHYPFGDVIKVLNRARINISEFNISSNGVNSVLELEFSHSLIISNNILLNGWDGVYAYGVHDSIFRNNIVSSNKGTGFEMQYSSNVSILNNTILDNVHKGIDMYYSENSSIENNTFMNTSLAIYAVDYHYSENNLSIKNNFLFNNSGDGICIDSCHNQIFNNIIMNNDKAIHLAGDDQYYSVKNNIIKENTLFNNSDGVYIEDLDYQQPFNIVYHNNFIQNSINAHGEGNNTWNNSYSDPLNLSTDGGNYWSDYTGHDLNHGPGQNVTGPDGIGDTTYNIPGDGNKDHYPLMQYYINESSHQPIKPKLNGPTTGLINQEYTFTIDLQDPSVKVLSYYVDWGDEQHDGWIGPYVPGDTISIKHIWQDTGSFQIRTKIKDILNTESNWSDPFNIVMSQLPPNQPLINGPTKGKPLQTYDFTIVATDPENQSLQYFIDWGDGSNTSWIGPYNSSEEITVSHDWDSRNIFSIKAKARDKYKAESDWGLLRVKIPYQPPHFPIITWLLDHLQQYFPLLYKLFNPT